MTVAPGEEPTELGTAIPEHPQKRDLLGMFCFYFHFVVMIFIVTGWLIPVDAVVVFYLVFLPGVFTQWRLNKDTCILNNIESVLRTGRWRNPTNREEGAWLLTLARGVTGWQWLTSGQMDAFTNTVMATLWLLGLARLERWF